MAKRRSVRSPKAKQPTSKKTKKTKRVTGWTSDDDDFIASLNGFGKIVGTAYGYTSFPIRENQPWSDARFDAGLRGHLWLRFADCFPGGVIVGLEDQEAAAYFESRFAEYQTDELYSEPVSDAKSPEPYAQSDREHADSLLTVRSAVALHDFISNFLALATLAATSAAMLVGIDEMANRPTNPAAGTWWAIYRDTAPGVRPVTDDERKSVVKTYSDAMRDLLRNCLFADGATSRMVGRKPEENRDHRAYCMRERLVRSPTSIYARLSEQERFRRAKRDVLMHIILRKSDDTCSDSNWTRIMSSGKSVHVRVAGDAPYCENV